MDIKAITIGGIDSPLPSSFQPGKGIQKVYSILDSCTSQILLPKSVFDDFVSKLKSSGAFSDTFIGYGSYYTSWFDGTSPGLTLEGHIDFDKLPSLAFVVASQTKAFKNITLEIGPRHYILQDKTLNYC